MFSFEGIVGILRNSSLFFIILIFLFKNNSFAFIFCNLFFFLLLVLKYSQGPGGSFEVFKILNLFDLILKPFFSVFIKNKIFDKFPLIPIVNKFVLSFCFEIFSLFIFFK